MVQVSGASLETDSVSATQWIAVLLVLVTGVIHVYSGIVEGRIPVSLAGVGFLGAIGVFLLDYRRPLLYLVGMVYTAVQLPLWYVVKAGEYTTLGYVDKSVQVLLVLLLGILYYSHRSSAGTSPGSSTA